MNYAEFNPKGITLKPFVKWAGGKRQLLTEIRNQLPPDISVRTYIEPFAGGGALFFSLMPHKALINDANSELMLSYRVIRDSVEKLIEVLEEHESKNSAEYYYKVRALDVQNYSAMSDTEKAGRFIFLNKICYNGLYRVNSQGFFNVPAGRYKNFNICEKPLLRAISDYLNSADIVFMNMDFEKAAAIADKNSFVYFDPPYHSLKRTGFKSYQADGFGEEDQIRLRDLFLRLGGQEIPCLLSNADTPFIREIYRHDSVRIIPVTAKRFINSDQNGRGSVNEVLIKNYN